MATQEEREAGVEAFKDLVASDLRKTGWPAGYSKSHLYKEYVFDALDPKRRTGVTTRLPPERLKEYSPGSSESDKAFVASAAKSLMKSSFEQGGDPTEVLSGAEVYEKIGWGDSPEVTESLKRLVEKLGREKKIMRNSKYIPLGSYVDAFIERNKKGASTNQQDSEQDRDLREDAGELEKRFGSFLGKVGSVFPRPVSSVIAIAGILGGIFFLSSNITGNAIADLTIKTTSFLGAGSLIIGLVAGLFLLKKNKK